MLVNMNTKKLILEKLLYCEYQPLTNLQDETFAFEALMRSNPRINPLTIIQDARNQGILYELDTLCMNNAIGEFPISYVDKYFLFVNVFSSTIIHPKFMKFIQNLISRYPHIKERVVFEINEDKKEDSLLDLLLFFERLVYLKSVGIRIALDDIPIRRTLFERMEKFVPHFVKLDHTYSKDLAHSKEKQQLISLVLDYTDENVELVLEGIETEEDLLTAKDLGVPLFQGYYISKPFRIMEERFVHTLTVTS